LVGKLEALLMRLPQPVPDQSGQRHQIAAGRFGDQAWSALGARWSYRLPLSSVCKRTNTCAC
jgi:hypothetical protein